MLGRQDFPILKDCKLVLNKATRRYQIKGRVYNSKIFNDGELITTSYISIIDIGNKTVRTKNSIYRLGDIED